MIKTFKGKMKNDTNKRIKLSTKEGLVGYKIVKFQTISTVPLSTESKSLAKIYATVGGTAEDTSSLDFDSPTLLAVSLFTSSGSVQSYPEDMTVIIDNKTINQDIYITMRNTGSGNNDINFYLELEVIKLDLNEATVATLRDMRGRE